MQFKYTNLYSKSFLHQANLVFMESIDELYTD